MGWLSLLKWAKNVPVLFAHFPGPSLLLVGVAMVVAGGMASCVTHKLEAGARAELKIELADAKAAYAERRTEAAEKRVDTINAAAKEQRAIDLENQRAWRDQLSQLGETLNDKNALANIGRSLQELHRDPALECRLLPLPRNYLDGLQFGVETPRPTAGAAGSH